MNKKFVIVGALVLLLVLSIGIFFFVSQTKKSKEFEYKSTPTEWSQAGDYEIKEVAGAQTVVSNKKAGFSFKVPEGWNTENRGGEVTGEYVFNMRSPDASFQKDKNGNELEILGGCVISFETEYQKDTVDSILIDIELIKESLGKVKSDNKGELIKIGQITGVKTSLMPPKDSKYYKSFGSTITIEVPRDNKTAMRFGTRMAPWNEVSCEKAFSDFTKNITIEI